MSALTDRKPTTIGIFEVRYWDAWEYTESPISWFEDERDATAERDRLNQGPRTTGSRYFIRERVLHLRRG
jgi:hypothetical protein